jgi:hypothetical protein
LLSIEEAGIIDYLVIKLFLWINIHEMGIFTSTTNKIFHLNSFCPLSLLSLGLTSWATEIRAGRNKEAAAELIEYLNVSWEPETYFKWSKGRFIIWTKQINLWVNDVAEIYIVKRETCML